MPSKFSARSGGRRTDRCRECRRHESEAGRMSARDLCTDCAHARFSIPADQMVAKSGPAYDQWVRSMLEFADRLTLSN